MRSFLKSKRRAAALILLLLMTVMTFAGSLSVSADSSGKQFVYDDSGVLTDSQEKELEQLAHEIAEAKEVDLIILFVNQKLNTTGKITKYGDDFYDQKAFGYDKPYGDGVLLIVDTQARNYYVGTSGDAVEFFTDSRLDILTSDIVDKLSVNDWEGGAKAFLKYIKKNYRDPSKPITMNDRIQASAQRLPIYLIIAVGISVIVILIMVKNRANKTTTGSATYLRAGSFMLLQNDDVFTGENTTRVRIRSNDSGRSGGRTGGGGGGVHISSGGFTHGGRAGKF